MNHPRITLDCGLVLWKRITETEVASGMSDAARYSEKRDRDVTAIAPTRCNNYGENWP